MHDYDPDLGLSYGRRFDIDRAREKLNEMRKELGLKEEEKSSLKYRGRLTGFVIVPDELIYAGENLSHAEFRLWIILRKHCREKNGKREPAFPERERLAKLMGMKSLYRISNLLKSLEEKGIIKVERHYLGKPNRYDVYDPPKGWLICSPELKRSSGLQGFELKIYTDVHLPRQWI